MVYQNFSKWDENYDNIQELYFGLEYLYQQLKNIFKNEQSIKHILDSNNDQECVLSIYQGLQLLLCFNINNQEVMNWAKNIAEITKKQVENIVLTPNQGWNLLLEVRKVFSKHELPNVSPSTTKMIEAKKGFVSLHANKTKNEIYSSTFLYGEKKQGNFIFKKIAIVNQLFFLLLTLTSMILFCTNVYFYKPNIEMINGIRIWQILFVCVTIVTGYWAYKYLFLFISFIFNKNNRACCLNERYYFNNQLAIIKIISNSLIAGIILIVFLLHHSFVTRTIYLQVFIYLTFSFWADNLFLWWGMGFYFKKTNPQFDLHKTNQIFLQTFIEHLDEGKEINSDEYYICHLSSKKIVKQICQLM